MVSDTLLNLVKSFEGCRLEAYQDIVGVWTIGYGCTGTDIVEGLVWTQEEANHQLAQRLEALQEQIQKIVPTGTNQNQLDALCDFAYNVGLGALKSSFLLKCLNAGNFAAASKQFERWDRAGGKEVPGLLRRRQAEAALFSSAC